MHDFSALSLFLLTGLPLLAFGLVFGVQQWIHLHEINELASAGIVMIAAMPIILLPSLDTTARVR